MLIRTVSGLTLNKWHYQPDSLVGPFIFSCNVRSMELLDFFPNVEFSYRTEPTGLKAAICVPALILVSGGNLS